MFSIFKILVIALIFMCEYSILAYPNYISFSYQSCLTCHYNPFGNGQLTDYGRAVNAAEIIDTTFTKDKLTENELSEISGFMFGKVKSNKLKPSLSYRGLYLKTNVGEDTTESSWINMMADVGLVYRPLETDNLIIVGSIGYAPSPLNNPNSEEDNYRSREHYIGFRINKNHGFYFGMMDKVFGLRIPDHNSFSRSVTSLTMNDGAHSALYHYTNTSIDVGLQYFIGNLSQEADLRQVGASAQIEYSINNTFRIGSSYLSQSNRFLEQVMYSLHTRRGIGKGSSIMAEFGRVTKKTISSGDDNTSQYLFLQNHIQLKRGLFTILTFEHYKSNLELEDSAIKIGPALQYFPFVGVELRADLYNTKVISPNNYSNDNWVFAGQVHLWL